MADVRASTLRPVVQLWGFLRKEVTDILRQPRLLLVLVAGPFAVLLLFAAGYDERQIVLDTAFVGPDGSVYERAIDSYSEELDDYVQPKGFTSDLLEARGALEDGDVDVVVVFPPEPAESILGGEQAEIAIIHDKLDPLQQTAVEVAARVAVLELNAGVLEEIVGRTQTALTPLRDGLTALDTAGDDAAAALRSGDAEQIRARATELATGLGTLDAVNRTSAQVIEQLGAQVAPSQQEAAAAFQADLAELSDLAGRLSAGAANGDQAALDEDAARVETLVDDLTEYADDLVAVDPALLIRPFAARTENLLREPVGVIDFFAPSAIALLLQHMAVTFAAMGLVRDEAVGLFESFRVAPIGPPTILGGKYASYLVIGGAVAAVLLLAVAAGLDVPVRGPAGWVVGGIGLLLLSSVGLGLVLSGIARSDSQAVQFAMLVLLASLFFGGFFLDLDTLRYPVKALSWLLPVTYGIRILQDVMLRGDDPAAFDVAGLVVTAVVYGGVAAVLLRHRLRVE
jgi:ABC-2 type transport system permease protein